MKVIQPKFNMNDIVWFKVSAQATEEITLSDWREFTIVGISRTSNERHETYEYDLSNDPPRAYYHGTVSFKNVSQEKIFYDIPEEDDV